MILHLAAATVCLTGIQFLRKLDSRGIRNLWYDVITELNLKNSASAFYEIRKLEKTKFGYILIVRPPIGFSLEELKGGKSSIESAFKCDVLMSMNKGYIKVKLLYNPLKDLKFVPIPTKPHELYCGYDHSEHIITDMNKNPHMLIAGITNSGKTRMFYTVLANLIANSSEDEIELYFSQLEKSDLTIFEGCKQVKGTTRDIVSSLKLFEDITNEMRRRIKLFERYTGKGILNIEDYNKHFNKKPLRYMYLCLEEFSIFMPDYTDNKFEATIKAQCLDHIKVLIKTARSSGIFVIMALQSTTCDQMPVFVRRQVNNRMSFKQTEKASSENAIGTDEATKLKRREAILVNNDDRYKVSTPYIDFDMIMESIKHRMNDDAMVNTTSNDINFTCEASYKEVTLEEVAAFKENAKKAKNKVRAISNGDGIIKKKLKGGNVKC